MSLTSLQRSTLGMGTIDTARVICMPPVLPPRARSNLHQIYLGVTVGGVGFSASLSIFLHSLQIVVQHCQVVSSGAMFARDSSMDCQSMPFEETGWRQHAHFSSSMRTHRQRSDAEQVVDTPSTAMEATSPKVAIHCSSCSHHPEVTIS